MYCEEEVAVVRSFERVHPQIKMEEDEPVAASPILRKVRGRKVISAWKTKLPCPSHSSFGFRIADTPASSTLSMSR